MWYRLPPVGNRISIACGKGSVRRVAALFSPYLASFYQSGTAALAAAVTAAVTRRPTTCPEVLLPAYGCPDLISAVLYAGASPVLVDLVPNTPWLDLALVQAKINERTVAIIAVNFLGIGERMSGLRAIADAADITLIEDSAQCLYEPENSQPTCGDFIVQSFGRGKPVSLLGGGALLWQDPSLGSHLPPAGPMLTPNPARRFINTLKTMLYNILLTPRIYGLMERVPILHIGETRFKPLERILPANAVSVSCLPVNLELFRHRQHKAQQWIRAMLNELCLDEIIDLTCLNARPEQSYFLRYPILVPDSDLRERLYSALRSAGLGVSKMYPAALPEIPGLTDILRSQERFPRATKFAKSILTLPTHENVSRRHVAEMGKIIMNLCVKHAAH